MTRRHVVAVAIGALLSIGPLAACTETASAPAPVATREVPVGDLPATSPVTTGERNGGLPNVVPRSIPRSEQVGTKVSGNRVLLIGDSVMASTSQRHGGAMCSALVPLGWAVDVEAETGRFTSWGSTVLDAKLAEDFDVVVILLGNNFLGDEEVFRRDLERMLRRLTAVQVVLTTVTEFTPNRRDVNQVIRGAARTNSAITLLDWASVTAADDTLTGGDGLHLNERGKSALAAEVAAVLGDSPSGKGSCLPSLFVDDSRGPVTGSTTTAVTGTTTSTTVPSTSTDPVSTEPTSG